MRRHSKIVLAATVLATASWAFGAPVMPAAPDYGWAFDEDAGTTAAAAFGNVDGSVKGGAWSGTTNFGYAGNGSLELSGGISDGQEVWLDDVGGSDKISINDAGANNAFTISAWIFDRDDQNTNRASLFGNWFDATQNIMLWNTTNADSITLLVRQQGDVGNQVVRVTPLAQWVHVVGVWDGNASDTGTATLYVNDQFETISNAGVTEGWAVEDGYRIGGDSRGNNVGKGRNRMFNGFIDEVAVWKSALTADEVEWLRQNSMSEIPEPGTLTLLAGCGLALLRRRK